MSEEIYGVECKNPNCDARIGIGPKPLEIRQVNDRTFSLGVLPPILCPKCGHTYQYLEEDIRKYIP